MKKLILILFIGLFSITVSAQEKKSKNKNVTFTVAGNCDMCKKRIEKAAYAVKGVKNAEWHSDHQDIHLIIDERKCSAQDVAKAIAKVGHDTEFIKALDQDYENLHNCCFYERL